MTSSLFMRSKGRAVLLLRMLSQSLFRTNTQMGGTFRATAGFQQSDLFHKTTPQYLQELVPQYNPPCFPPSSSLCRLSIHKQKTFSGKVIPRYFTHPLEQASRQASPSKRHCFLSVAAFHLRDSVIFLPAFPPPCLSSLIVPPPPPISFAKCNEHGVFLHGAILHSTRGH